MMDIVHVLYSTRVRQPTQGYNHLTVAVTWALVLVQEKARQKESRRYSVRVK